MRDELTSLSMVELAAFIRRKEVSPVEVAESYLARIREVNAAINAIVTIAPRVIEEAEAAEKALANGSPVGPLHGVPITIKDTIATEGIRTTSGSRLPQNHVPAKDAHVVTKLKAAGAIILGKTNTPEMAIPYETDNPVFGRTNNPYNTALTSGGSSGGEAAAIAACLSPGGLGSDLSGSIRVPAHFCGIVGLRPASGLLSMDGHLPIAHDSLAFGACIGPMARRVADVELLLAALIEPAAPIDRPSLRGLRMAWYDDDGITPVSEETRKAVRAAVTALENAGLEAVNTRPPGIESGAQLWIDLFSGTAAADLRDFYSGKENLAGPVVQRVLNAKTKRPTEEEMRRILRERNALRDELLLAMNSWPLIVAPVGATTAFPHGTTRLNIDGASISTFNAFSYAQTFNVFDLPAVAVPVGLTGNQLPIGVQIVGRPNGEKLVLAAAAIVEAASGGWQPPKLVT